MRVLIAVIAYNEERNISRVLDELEHFRRECAEACSSLHYDVVVVDNSSTDSTDTIVRKRGTTLVRHPINNGGSMGTVLTYFRYADQLAYDVVLQFDGDGQHIAAEIPKIVAPIVQDQADYVVGSRYIEGRGFQSTQMRRFGIRLFNLASRLVCGDQVSDSTSGFRAYSRSVIALFARNFPHEFTDPVQLRVIAKYCGVRIAEVPVQMRERKHGTSEFDLLNSIRFVVKGVITMIACRIQCEHLRRTASVKQSAVAPGAVP